LRGQVSQQIVDQGVNAGIVGAVERHKGQLIVAGGGDDLARLLQKSARRPFSHRPVSEPRLAESATVGATAGDLYLSPVVDHFDPGHQRAGGVLGCIEVLDHALADLTGRRVVPCRNVHSINRRDCIQDRFASPVPGRLDSVQHLPEGFLPIANHKSVE